MTYPKIFLGVIVAIKDSLASVEYTGTVSDFYPYLQQASSFKTHLLPPQVGESVILIKLDSNNGFILGSFVKPSTKLESDTETTIYKDGTKITYKEGVFKIESLKTLSIECESANIKASKDVVVESKSATIKADSIKLGDHKLLPTAGCVTGECICPFTGAPHADISKTVLVKK
ncbi:phage baseplate assembly protein V [Helicobacter sp. 11S02629-2]|uniref:phage baseplate assembly protein V n=1 Tax=Helicobacter sp. 11S02629-2 TaxID=1476195 RepID=UPI000BD07C3D|nr:phage baseplate assembly protein V [Helicobacter sp. 11S02629-2]PAF44185.1 hypothetical protein BKH40_06200 [Helicobacter sp. 11S02629-2]